MTSEQAKAILVAKQNKACLLAPSDKVAVWKALRMLANSWAQVGGG